MAASRINKSEVTEQPAAIDDTIVLHLRASPADRVRSPLALPGSGAWPPDAPAVRGTHRDGGQRCSAHRSTGHAEEPLSTASPRTNRACQSLPSWPVNAHSRFPAAHLSRVASSVVNRPASEPSGSVTPERLRATVSHL